MALNNLQRLICHKTQQTKPNQTLTISLGGCNKRVHSFLKCVRPKVNVIAELEFELAYYDVTDQHISHSGTETHLHL